MNDLEIAGKFAGLHGLDKDMLDTTHISRDALRDWVRDHRDALLSLDLRQEGALRKFRRPYLVALVSEMRSDRMEPAFYLAVESSYSAEEKDIDKATDNAKILRAVTERQAYPVVAAARLHPRMSDEARARLYEDVDRYVAAGDGDTALWYRLDSGAGVPTKEENDAFFRGVDRAMRRAAVEARQRAIDTQGYVETWRDGKIVRDTEV